MLLTTKSEASQATHVASHYVSAYMQAQGYRISPVIKHYVSNNRRFFG